MATRTQANKSPPVFPDRTHLLRQVIHATVEAIILLNDAGEILMTNASCKKIFGYNEEELRGQKIEVLVPDQFRLLLQELRKGYMENLQTRPMGVGRDLHGRKKDGTEFPIEVSLGHFRYEGHTYLTAFVSDITVRHQIEVERSLIRHALQHEKDMLQTYLDIAPVIFVIVGSDRKVSKINKYGAALLGYEEHEVIGKNWFTHFIPARHRKDVRTVQRELLELDPTKHQRFENTIRTKDGQERIISWQNAQLTDEEGNPIATLSAGIDITEKKTHDADITNAIVAGQEKERKRLAEDLHDGLGPLLSSVKHNLEAIEPLIHMARENKVKYYENSKWLLERAIHEVREMSHNLMPKTLSEFGLVSALKGLAELMGQTSGIHMEFYADFEDRLELESLEITLYRIAQEVLNNALRHSQATQITIQLLKDEETVVMTVEDNGKGFIPDQLEPGNSGIGLRSIKSRAHAVNGRLRISSSPSHGTLVNVEIPLHQWGKVRSDTKP